MSTIEHLRSLEGRKLSTDEYAEARNNIKNLINELEGLRLEAGEGHLLFKWGTLKSWDVTSERGLQLLKEYGEIGSSASAIMQRDNDRQRDIICELIDECDGPIQSDWTGEYFTKEQAKAYILDYEA